MKTILLEQPGEFRRIETAYPVSPGPGEVVVKVSRIGICGTDLHAFCGRQPYFTYPRILGHELGAEILEVGPECNGIKKGDLCSVEPYLNCGDCIACRMGKTNCCTRLELIGVHRDGGMREQILVPANRLHKSETLSVDQLALIEMLGIGAHAVDRGGVEKDEWTLVIGAGPIGLSVVQFALLAGAKVLILEQNPKRVAFCREWFSISHSLDGSSGDIVSELQDTLGGELPTAVFDATGNADSMCTAFDFVASGGRLVLVGIVQDEIRFQDAEFHRREMTLYSTRNALSTDFTRIISLMESGVVNTDPWITHRADYTNLLEKFPTWLDPSEGVVKAMLTM
ncbi:MAG TPA: alcohol dehydrogenase [Candidatus Latescibacteria bacterium]|nr:alcohol dehydrogenase [Candidatus Latescibacterota bacterium]